MAGRKAEREHKSEDRRVRQQQGRVAYLKPENVQNTNKVGGIQGSVLTRKGNVHATDDPIKTPTVYGLHERVPRIGGLIRIQGPVLLLVSNG